MRALLSRSRVLGWLALQAMLLGLGAVSLAWNAVALLLYPVLPLPTGRRIGRAAITRIYAGCWRVGIAIGLLDFDNAALDTLRDEAGLVVVANHPSMVDALLLVARLPKSACVMRANLMRNPFLGPGARLARYLRNDSPRGLIRLAVEDLRQGGQLVLFPEGTRTTRPPVDRFRPGFTLIAKLARAPIQAVFIDTDSPYLRKGWPLWRLPPLPIRFAVRLGRRFAPAHDAAALLAEIEAHFVAGLRA